MQSAVRISRALTGYIAELETTLNVPIRVLTGGGQMVVTSRGTQADAADQYGYSTQWLRVPWDDTLRNTRSDAPAYPHTDWEQGVTLVSYGTPFMPRAVTMGSEYSIPSGSDMERVNTRLRSAGVLWLMPDYMDDPPGNAEIENAEVQGFAFEGTDVAYAYAYSEVEGLTGALVLYPFQIESLAADTFNRERWLNDPITAAIGSEGGSDEERLARYKQRYLEFSDGRIGRRILEARRAVAVHESSANDAANRYQEALDQLREQKMTLDALVKIKQGNGGIDPDTEWERLLEHKMVKEVRVSSGRFQIFTTPLEMLDPDTGEQYPLGEYKITFPMAPGSGRGVTMRNLTDRKSPGDGLPPRDHPHVENERPCFGSLMSEIARLSASGEVGGMVEAALQFLQTFNPQDDYGRYAGLWGVDRDGDGAFEGEVWDARRE